VWSGELRTRYNNYRYGRYEVKMAAPIANPGQQNNDGMSGNFLAMMFAYRTPRNVQWAEIDVILQADQHAKVNTNLISATGAVGYPTGNATPGTYTPPTSYAIYDEHEYAFEWTPSSITWYLDGQAIRTVNGSAQVPIPSVSVKIMLSLWVFGSGVAFGNPALNEFPFSATYDYVRFYRLNTDTTYPCTPAPACLPAADKTSSSQNNPREPNYGQ
jgi:beta-glucanase (GH16 family)